MIPLSTYVCKNVQKYLSVAWSCGECFTVQCYVLWFENERKQLDGDILVLCRGCSSGGSVFLRVWGEEEFFAF